MPTTSHDARLTYNDFVLLPDDGRRHEIIDGVHYVTPSPNVGHQELVLRLALALGRHLEDRPDRGRLFVAPLDVVCSFYDVVEPDLVFVAPDQFDILTDQNIQGTPALVIEILSPSTRKRDQGVKRRLYDRSGVREYWLVDPATASVTIFRRHPDGSFRALAPLTALERQTLKTPLLAGWSLTLARLFRCHARAVNAVTRPRATLTAAAHARPARTPRPR